MVVLALSFLVTLFIALYASALESRRARARFHAELAGVERDTMSLGPARSRRPAIVCLERFAGRPVEREPARSPYRQDAGAGARGDERTRRQRGRAALRNAKWLLLAASEDARAAARLSRFGLRRASARRVTRQHRAESEALQCVYEAEACLGRSIVPREDGAATPCYGAAAGLLATVSSFYAERFPSG